MHIAGTRRNIFLLLRCDSKVYLVFSIGILSSDNYSQMWDIREQECGLWSPEFHLGIAPALNVLYISQLWVLAKIASPSPWLA